VLARPPDWHTAQVREWLAGQPQTRQWIAAYATNQLQVMALRLCVSNTTWELLGVNFALVDWLGLAAELSADPPRTLAKRTPKTT
jgi:hypothetical protein